jgi:hypothetical protein
MHQSHVSGHCVIVCVGWGGMEGTSFNLGWIWLRWRCSIVDCGEEMGYVLCVWGYIGYLKGKLPKVVPFKNTPISIYAFNMRTIYPVIYSKYLFIYFSEPHWWRKIVSVIMKSWKSWNIVLAHTKQQSADRHVAPLWHIILIPRQPDFTLSPEFCVLSERREKIPIS